MHRRQRNGPEKQYGGEDVDPQAARGESVFISSQYPLKKTKVLPVPIRRTAGCALTAKRHHRRNPSQRTIPAPRGVTELWIFRSPGKSTILYLFERLIESGVMQSPQRKSRGAATKKFLSANSTEEPTWYRKVCPLHRRGRERYSRDHSGGCQELQRKCQRQDAPRAPLTLLLEQR